MLQLDAIELYDLSEAGSLLLADPVRLARQARLGRVPATHVGQQLGLPRPWVDAEAGRTPVDPVALREYWLARFAPPSAGARRPSRERSRLPVENLLAADEAASRIFADRAALIRLARDGTLPPLLIDGEPLYDETLTDLVARAAESPELRPRAQARRAEVVAWARFEYRTAPVPPLTTTTPSAPARPREAPEPGAYEIPDDLLAGIDNMGAESKPAPPSTLIEAEGFQTVDDDD